MKINKKEIIDEIISLEPKLNVDRVRLENILENIINMKPDINISPEFKKQLKEQLLLELNAKSKIDEHNKYNVLKLFISFVLWWVTVYSMIWIFWINLSLFNLEETGNITPVWIEQFQEKDESMIKRSVPVIPEASLMKVNIDEDIAVSSDPVMEEFWIMQTEVSIEENELFNELRTYLESIGLSDEIIEEILNIIRKYK